MNAALERLKGKLVVSSQVMDPRSPLGRPDILAMMAEAAGLGGAGGYRVDGVDVVRELRARTSLPIIGIAKDRRTGFDVYITTTVADVNALCDVGADIVAAQATSGTRPGESFAELTAAAHARGAAMMADISTFEEAITAAEQGADVIATTMVGYTPQSTGAARPAFDLVRELVGRLDMPVIVEGGVWTPEHVAASFAAGAFAVVSGSAITAPDLITKHLLSGL
ncbi:MAG: putative N-acetylmannosamine-6-phosphate 2-epimerase [Devosia nanyangense]|jgi:N-acylglucosamine-6-phosphate 2-epimerase|nr:putative N-acetylmannosamine-6-phosphate 2-epimerase [Devosia nanyangense]